MKVDFRHSVTYLFAALLAVHVMLPSMAVGCELSVRPIVLPGGDISKALRDLSVEAKKNSVECGIAAIYITNVVQSKSDKPGVYWAQRMIKYVKEREVVAVAHVVEGKALESEGYFAIYVRGYRFVEGTFADLSAKSLDEAIAGLKSHAADPKKFVSEALLKQLQGQADFYRLMARHARANWYRTFDDPEIKTWATSEAEAARRRALAYSTYSSLLSSD